MPIFLPPKTIIAGSNISVTDTSVSATVSVANVGSPNGIASLDGGGKVPITQLPSAIMEYKGTWDATTNTPTLADGIGDTGDVYRVNVGGTRNLGSGNITFDVGDYVIYNGTIWEKSDTTDAVASVNGLTGIVTLTTANINDSSNRRYITDAQQTVLNNTSGVNTGNQTITLTGDVTGSGTGTFGATIATDAVTYAKMQNVSATSRVLGRKGAGSGDVEECTLSEVLDFVATTPARGDIIYRGASTWTRLSAGSSGRYLQTAGTGGDPAWGFNYAFKNIIINGDMQVAQRNTSVPGIVASGYNTADRWRTDLTSCGTWTQAVVVDAPTGTPFRNSLRMTVTTAKTPAASDICRIDQRFEGQNLLGMLKGSSNARPLTLSFWVKGSIAGTYIAELCDNNNTRQVSASYQIAVANTWEFKTITFPADTTGTLTNDNNYSLCIGFWLAAGPNFRSGNLQTSWGNTAGNRAVGQVSVSATVSATWQITGAQLEYGAVATDFECLPFHLQETLCERYLPRAAISNRTAPTNGQEHHFGGASPYANVGLILFNFSTKARRDPTGVVLTLADFTIYDLLSGGYGPLTAVASLSSGFVNTTVAFTADSAFGGPLAFTKGGVLFLVPTAGAPTRNIIFNGCEL